MKIVVDAMGGDHGVSVTVPAVVEIMKENNLQIILTGIQDIIEKEISKYDYPKNKIEVVHCSEVITNEDKPVQAVRTKKDSSMTVALKLVKEKKADAVISAGNTGALLTGGLFILGRLKGIDRPALTLVLPTLKGGSVLIDAGANADCKPKNLLQFGIMGSIYAEKVLNINKPRVCLINIGQEEGKGNELLKESYVLCQKAAFNFQGNMEAREILSGYADVMVCDGFTGNIILKSSEGVAGTIFELLKNKLTKNILCKFAAAILKPELKDFKKKFDYAEYGGAPFLGVDGVLIKAHGSSGIKAVKNAIKQAKILTENNIIEEIRNEINVLGVDVLE